MAPTGNPTTPIDTSYFTRYQMYLFELGVEFGRNQTANACDAGGTSDCRTIYPIPTDEFGADVLPTGFTKLIPAAADIPLDNTTLPVPSPADPTRRLFKVAVVGDCSTAEDGGEVKGSANIDQSAFDIVTH